MPYHAYAALPKNSGDSPPVNGMLSPERTSCKTEIKFATKSGTCSTLVRTSMVPLGRFNLIVPIPTDLAWEPPPKRTRPDTC